MSKHQPHPQHHPQAAAPSPAPAAEAAADTSVAARTVFVLTGMSGMGTAEREWPVAVYADVGAAVRDRDVLERLAGIATASISNGIERAVALANLLELDPAVQLCDNVLMYVVQPTRWRDESLVIGATLTPRTLATEAAP